MEKRFPKSKRPKLLSKKSKQTLIKTAPTIHQIALQVDRKKVNLNHCWKKMRKYHHTNFHAATKKTYINSSVTSN